MVFTHNPANEYAAGGVTTRYYYDSGWRVLAEITDDGEVEARYNYIHSNYLDEKRVRMMDRFIANDYLSPKEVIK